jgi:hypothetical protein
VGDRAALRLPVYSRTDLRIARRTRWGKALLEPSLSLLNVLNRTNVLQYEWDYTTSPALRVTRSQLPFLPSIGLDVSF